MKVKDYARATGVHPRTIYERIISGQIIPKSCIDAHGAYIDIDITIYPVKSFIKRLRGRPAGSKNKTKFK